ncbi:uncharacterized protein LOC133815138 [Humulus lupulus]|uniref:uncharacterized protein LOC133815138 n=1 Tax=Humulus lupulus TaxID=3486 RepID=UPI002B402A7C|nr:uncharacterized protein LOC133815138 [Humulus lupulus]
MSLQKEIINDGIEFVKGGLANLTLQSSLLEQIREGHKVDEALVKQEALVRKSGSGDFTMSNGGFLRYKDGICVPNNDEIKEIIIKEAHKTPYSLYPGLTKMCQDLKALYWWPSMKKDIDEFVARCLTCQQVKVQHQRPRRLLQLLYVP